MNGNAGEIAAAELDVLRMAPAIERYRDRLADATADFVLKQQDVPTYWIAVLGCLGKEVADVLHGLRNQPDACEVFAAIVADQLARNEAREA